MQVWIGFADPCGLQEYPGWYLRNLLVLAKVQLGLANVTVVCLREKPGKDDISRSLVLDVVLGSAPDLAGRGRNKTCGGQEGKRKGTDFGRGGDAVGRRLVTAPCPKAIGWEKNEQDKLQPRHMDLGPMMDPIRCVDAGPARLRTAHASASDPRECGSKRARAGWPRRRST